MLQVTDCAETLIYNPHLPTNAEQVSDEEQRRGRGGEMMETKKEVKRIL
jgi:hypothetical protein